MQRPILSQIVTFANGDVVVIVVETDEEVVKVVETDEEVVIVVEIGDEFVEGMVDPGVVVILNNS